MWWWLVLLSVCHRLPSSGKGDSTSSYSDCLHWCEDPPHLLVAVPMKMYMTEGNCLLLPPPSLWLLSWFTLLLLLMIWSRTSEPAFPSSITNWGPALPRNPWVFGTRLWLLKYPASRAKQILSCCFLQGTDNRYGCSLCTSHPASKTEQLLGSSPAAVVTILTLVDSMCMCTCMCMSVFTHPIGSGCQLNFPSIRLGCLTNPVLQPFTWYTPRSLCQLPEAIALQHRHYILVDVRLTLKEWSRSLACPLEPPNTLCCKKMKVPWVSNQRWAVSLENYGSSPGHW